MADRAVVLRLHYREAIPSSPGTLESGRWTVQVAFDGESPDYEGRGPTREEALVSVIDDLYQDLKEMSGQLELIRRARAGDKR